MEIYKASSGNAGNWKLAEGQDCFLSEDDKAFILRKAEDIPDPLTLVLVPNSISDTSECLPIAGRIGCLPVYSTKPQIDRGILVWRLFYRAL